MVRMRQAPGAWVVAACAILGTLAPGPGGRGAAAAEATAGEPSVDAPPAVTAVDPLRDARRLLCTVHTAHLPGAGLLSSLESGLPSAIQMDLDLFDAEQGIVGRQRVFLRVLFDLWEEVFRVEGAGDRREFTTFLSLQQFLETVPRLPVAPLGNLAVEESHRIRVGLRVHPVAPRETARLGDWVAGEGPRGEEARGGEAADPDGREVSVRFGDLIRFFYKGARRPGPEDAERFSAWFVPAELPLEPGKEAGDVPDPD